MRAYLDEFQWNERLASVPQALRQKKTYELELQASKLGVSVVGTGKGYLDVDLSGVPDKQSIFSWLALAGIAAVDVEPHDVAAFLGRDFFSFMLVKALQTGAVRLERLCPDELMDALQNARAAASLAGNRAADETDQYTREIVQSELELAGLLDSDEEIKNEAWLNPKPIEEPEPDLSDFLPSSSNIYDPWGNR